MILQIRLQLRDLLGLLIRSISNPVVLIGVFGPLIQGVHFIFLRDSLGAGSLSGFSDLHDLLRNVWSYALTSYTIQVFVLLLSWVFVFVEFVRVVYPLIRQHNMDTLTKASEHSVSTYILVSFILLILAGGVWTFLSQAFASPQLVALYLPGSINTTGELGLPPLNSSITIARIVIVIEGVYFYHWKRNELPNILSRLGRSSPSHA